MKNVNSNIKAIQEILEDVFCIELTDDQANHDWLKVDDNVEKFKEGLIAAYDHVVAYQTCIIGMINLGRNDDESWDAFSDYCYDTLNTVASEAGFTGNFCNEVL